MLRRTPAPRHDVPPWSAALVNGFKRALLAGALPPRALRILDAGAGPQAPVARGVARCLAAYDRKGQVLAVDPAFDPSIDLEEALVACRVETRRANLSSLGTGGWDVVLHNPPIVPTRFLVPSASCASLFASGDTSESVLLEVMRATGRLLTHGGVGLFLWPTLLAPPARRWLWGECIDMALLATEPVESLASRAPSRDRNALLSWLIAALAARARAWSELGIELPDATIGLCISVFRKA